MSAESDRVTLVGPDIFTKGESYKMQGNTRFLTEGAVATGAVSNLGPANRHQPALVCCG